MKPGKPLSRRFNGLRYHVRTWDDRGTPQLFLPHGWVSVNLLPGELG